MSKAVIGSFLDKADALCDKEQTLRSELGIEGIDSTVAGKVASKEFFRDSINYETHYLKV